MITQPSQVYELLKYKNLDDQIEYSHPIKTKNKKVLLSLGRVWFNTLPPENYPLIDKPVDKKTVLSVIEDIFNKYEPKITSEFITKLNDESFKLGTICPSTFDIDSLVIPDSILKKKKELLIDTLPPDEFNKLRYDLAVEYLNYIKEHYDSGVYDILMSGAKGDPNEWALLMIAKGVQTDIEGNLSHPITSSLDEGLSLKEFYLSAGEARYTQYQKSKGSAEPGYLASRTAFANSNIVLQEGDCGSTKYMSITVTPSIAKMISGRYYLNGEKLDIIVDGSKFIKKTLQLRSPLYCKHPDGICSVCYGKLGERLNTNKIGLLSSATINDQGINTAMKSRHKTSQVSIKKTNFIKDIIR